MFNQRNSKKNLLILLVAMLGAQSCINKDDFEFDNLAGVKVNPSVAVPFLKGTLSIRDLIPKQNSEFIHEGEDGLIYLTFSDTLRSTSIHDHFLLETRKIEESYPAISGILSPEGKQVVVNDQQTLDFGFSDADFDEISLKNGKVVISARSTLNTEVELQVNFPTLHKEGVPLVMHLTLPPAQNRNSVSTEVDLNGYEADFTAYGTGENLLPIEILAEMDGGEGSPTNALDRIDFSLELGDLEFNHLTGYLGQPVVELTKSEIPISVFEGIFDKGKFGLKEPLLSFDILNSNGAPLKVSTNILQARNNDGEVVDIQLNPGSPIDVQFPSTLGGKAHTLLQVVNVGNVLDLAPSFIDYQLTGQLNLTPATSTNFITDSSEVSVVLNADIPLWGYMEGFSLTDTLSMALDLKEAEVKEASLRLIVENEFPLEAQLQIEFINENNDVLETLFVGDYHTLIPASTVTSEGDLATAGTYTGGDIEISSERFEQILMANRMIIKANMFTSRKPDGTHPHVKIKSTYELNVNLGVKTTTNLTAEL